MNPNTYLLLTRLNGLKPGAKQTLGEMVAITNHNERLRCKTIELPWRNNQLRISCIPCEVYEVVKRFSAQHGEHFHVLNVPDRDWILMHPANFSRQLLGCMAPGKAFSDIDGDGLRDVTSSRDTLDTLLDIMPDKFTLIINHVKDIGDLDPKSEKRL